MKEESFKKCIYCKTKLNKLLGKLTYCINCDKYFKDDKEVFFNVNGTMYYVEDQWINIEQ